MDVKILSGLTVVRNFENNYIVTTKKNLKSFVKEELNFQNADINKDNFLSFKELKDIKLNAIYNFFKDKVEFKKGIDLIDEELAKKIIKKNGLSIDDLIAFIEKLDKNSDDKITANEIMSNFSNISKSRNQIIRKIIVDKTVNEDFKNSQAQKIAQRIKEIEKQIQLYKKMLNKMIIASNAEKTNAESFEKNSIEKKLYIKELKNKYSKKDIDKLIQTIKFLKYTKNIDKIKYVSGTQATNSEIAKLVGYFRSDISLSNNVKSISDKNGIEQFSPANTPLVLDSKNIEYNIEAIKQKIAALEEEKNKLLAQLKMMFEKSNFIQ